MNHVMDKPLSERTDSEIMSIAMGLHHAIYISDCFGTNDLLQLEACVMELQKRGIEVKDESRIVFYKDGEEIE